MIQECPIQVISPKGFIAKTAVGDIHAEKVILATNGYTQGKGVFNWLSRRVFPVPSYIIATETLPPELIAELAPGRNMMVETRARYSYWRISPDGSRIILGGRASLQKIDLATAATRLKSNLNNIWPQLEPYKVSHVWRGNTGFNFNHCANVGVCKMVCTMPWVTVAVALYYRLIWE